MEAIYLKHWEEAFGQFLGVEADAQWLQVKMDFGVLLSPIGSLEARILSEELRGLRGQRIGILRTDLADRPIVVRIIEAEGVPTERVSAGKIPRRLGRAQALP